MRENGGIAPPFLTSELDGSEWSASRKTLFTAGTHWIGSWVGPRAGLEAMKKTQICVITGNVLIQ
jgi:hypothetical protein